MSKKTEVAVQQPQEMVFSEAVPSYLANQTGPARGAEKVGADDMIIPRLELVQALSPVRQKTDPTYIEGIEEGMMYNNVTRDVYGTEVAIIPVFYTKQYLVWKDRKKGGGAAGFRGAYNTELEAKQEIIRLTAEGDEFLEAIETAQHFCLLVDSSGKTSEIVMSMSRTKMKVSKRWNSLMRITGGDTFSRVYKIKPIVETNARNEKYYNFSVGQIGFAPESIYRKAEELYNQISRGGVVVDHTYDNEQPGEVPADNEF